MKCADHPSFDAVAQCGACLKALCLHCASLFSPPLCGDCATSHNKSVARGFYLTLAAMAAMLVVAVAVTAGPLPFLDMLKVALAAAFLPPGWQFLSKYLSPGNHYWSFYTRMLALAAHVAGAVTVGFIVGPIYLYKAWRELSTIRATRQMLQAHNSSSQQQPLSSHAALNHELQFAEGHA